MISENFIRGSFRIIVGPTSAPAHEITDFVVLDEGERQYDIVEPWKDLAATRTGIDPYEANGKRFLRTNLVEHRGSTFVIKAMGGPHHQPTPHSVVAMHKGSAEDDPIVALHFPIAVMREFSVYGIGESGGALVVWEVGEYRKIEW